MRAKTFGELRRKVHAQSLIDLGRRLRRCPLRPTTQEITIGSFVEDLEVQVRDAVLDMNTKGYCTWSSGFYASGFQCIDGPFTLDARTIALLEDSGVIVGVQKFWGINYSSIRFRPTTPDTTVIKKEWKKITSLIPSRGHRAILPENLGSAEFWWQYVSDKRLATLRLKRLIGAKRNHRWMKQWRRELKKLQSPIRTKPFISRRFA